MDVSIIVATYGDKVRWEHLAERALLSADNQTIKPYSTCWYHGKTLEEARNAGAAMTRSKWIIFLDADDTLDSGYVEGMRDGCGDIRQPMTLGVYADGHTDDFPVLIPKKSSFTQGNWIVIGAAVRRSFFEKVGGFGPEPLYEDFDLWIRCYITGAELGTAPKAIYRVSVNTKGRNEPDQKMKEYWFKTIVNKYHKQIAMRDADGFR